MRNHVYSAMTPENLAICKLKLTELEALLPENPVLTSIERQRLSKISFSGHTFVLEAISLSKDIPELKSSFVDMEDLEATLSFHQQTNELLTNLWRVQHWIDDLRMVSGSSVDNMARACYKNIKTAADHNVESAVRGYDRLKGRYTRRRNAQTFTSNGNGSSEGSGS